MDKVKEREIDEQAMDEVKRWDTCEGVGLDTEYVVKKKEVEADWMR